MTEVYYTNWGGLPTARTSDGTYPVRWEWGEESGRTPPATARTVGVSSEILSEAGRAMLCELVGSVMLSSRQIGIGDGDKGRLLGLYGEWKILLEGWENELSTVQSILSLVGQMLKDETEGF